MILDSSAIVAILIGEPERDIFMRLLAAETTLAMSAVTFHEASIVMAEKKKQPGAAQLVDGLVRDMAIEVSAVTFDDAVAAREAYFRYGRRYHPAQLNFGDCFSYVVAKSRDEPLLFKGEDFSKTDIVAAWRP
jgi:ribonuclease VapC